jgi:hypothetical protein
VRTFELYRREDETGVSGTGTIADGVEFDDGTTVIHWRGDAPSTVVWGSIDDAEAVHSHGGKTTILWHEGPPPTKADAEILDAWLIPGPAAPYHREMKNTVLLQWPTLGQAIEHLVREHHLGPGQD